MRLERAVPVLLSLLMLAAARPARAAWHSLEEIPVESPVYRLLDDVASNYPLSRGLLLTRPWTRGDLGRFLDQLVADVPAAVKDPAVLRLRRELEPGGGADGLEPAISTEQDDASFELSPYAQLAYAEDKPRGTLVRDDRAGLQASLAFGEHALLFVDGYAGTITPGPHGTPDGDGSYRASSTDVTAWFDRAYATWATRGFLVRAGHTWLRWGPGMSGTMALSDGAPAFDVLEARAALPGGAQLAWFVGSLDPAGQTYLAGHRLELRAGPSVQLSLSELARFDGAGNAPIYMLPVLPYALMERRVRGASLLPSDSLEHLARNNVMYAGDFSWTWRPGLRFYGELAVDDATLHNTRPLALAWQLGGQLRRLVNGTAWSLRGEYSRVYPYTYSLNNGQDFAHAGFPTAFPLGPDVDLWSGRLEWRPDAAWAFGLEVSDARKGAILLGQAWKPGQPVPTRMPLTFPVEQGERVALTADWSPSPSLTLAVAGGNAQVHGLGHVPGDDANGRFASARATFRW
jgi:capsule assembly protein Wzi